MPNPTVVTLGSQASLPLNWKAPSVKTNAPTTGGRGASGFALVNTNVKRVMPERCSASTPQASSEKTSSSHPVPDLAIVRWFRASQQQQEAA